MPVAVASLEADVVTAIPNALRLELLRCLQAAFFEAMQRVDMVLNLHGEI